MNLYIPFNMVIDTDVGIIRLVERLKQLPEYPLNNLKSFLLNREKINPIPEYAKLRNIDIEYEDELYDLIGLSDSGFYPSVLKLSKPTDILSFIINTYKLGYSKEVMITIGCKNENEINCLKNKLSKIRFSFDIRLNSELNFDDFEYIFNKYIDEYYVKDLIEYKKLRGKRLYISDHKFNTLTDDEGNKIVDIQYHIPLEANGIILSLISIYNKKKN